jgi:hypothetical protein
MGNAGKVAAFAVVMILAVGGMIYSQSTAQPLKPACVTDEDRVHIRAQVLAAVDDAFRDNVKHLFAGWLKDATRQPERASAGLQSSIVVYQRVRADALKWSPPSC